MTGCGRQVSVTSFSPFPDVCACLFNWIRNEVKVLLLCVRDLWGNTFYCFERRLKGQRSKLEGLLIKLDYFLLKEKERAVF